MTPKIRTQWENHTFKTRKVYETNIGPSETIPDQSMSLREMVRRHQMGLPVPAGHQPIWDEEDQMPDFRTLDLAEIEEYKNKYLEKIQEIEENQKTVAQRRQEKKELEKIEALKQQWLVEQTAKSTNTP